MDLKNRLFPYPILSPNNNDYIGVSFITNLNYEILNKDIQFNFDIQISNKEIFTLIVNEVASIAVLIDCPITSFRESIKFNKLNGEITINSNKISNMVTISFYIISNKDIAQYHNLSFNPIYKGLTFEIKKFGLLGIGDSFRVPIKKDHDDIKNVSSIFSIIPDFDSDVNLVTRDLFSSGKKIIIKLPKDQFDNYKVISKDQRNNPIIHSMLIVPILVEIFTLLKSVNNWDDYELNGWFYSIEKAFEKKNLIFCKELLEQKDPYHLAQMILDYPITNGLEKLFNISILGEDFEYES
jgi:hypothetical protein